MFIEYKAEMNGIPLTYIEPKYTSQECSRCGDMGIRDSKKFVCNNCKHVDHADANASFNIAQRPPIGEGIGQLNIDRDMFKGSTDTPQGATL
jgi:putative transposase